MTTHLSRTGRYVALFAAFATALLLVATPTAGVADDTADPNDPLWEDQWGPQQVRAHHAWSTSTGEGTTIAIVDSGIDLAHEDLYAQIVGGTTFIEGCRSDEDRATNDQCDRDGDWLDGEEDGDEHGTHVAGIAAAMTDNGVGIAGVAPDADLLAVKVLDSSGTGSFADVADGIVWSVDNGADVINLSLGGDQGTQVLAELGLLEDVVSAVEYANDNGVLVVAAAGNDAVPLCNEPSFRPGVLCVTATDRREAPAAYSSGGVKQDQLSVAAPGGSLLVVLCYEGVVSTVPEGEGISACDYPENEAYNEFDGTSMAAPHVAGVGALVLAQGCDRGEALDILTETARNPISDTRGEWNPIYGYGIVDAEAATAAAAERCESEDEDDDVRGNRPDHAGPPADRGKPDDRGKPGDPGSGNDRGNGDRGGSSNVPDLDLLSAYLGSLHIGR